MFTGVVMRANQSVVKSMRFTTAEFKLIKQYLKKSNQASFSPAVKKIILTFVKGAHASK